MEENSTVDTGQQCKGWWLKVVKVTTVTVTQTIQKFDIGVRWRLKSDFPRSESPRESESSESDSEPAWASEPESASGT